MAMRVPDILEVKRRGTEVEKVEKGEEWRRGGKEERRTIGKEESWKGEKEKRRGG